MAVSFKYWEDCVDPEDMEAMWKEPEVSTEWIDAGESRGKKVLLSRDPDGQAYLTLTEMRAVASIVVRRHFSRDIDPDMLCAMADLVSDRKLVATHYDKKTKETTLGIMQISQKNASWLASEMGYGTYQVQENPDLLFRPFVSVYFGAAYLKWLWHFENKERTEEFVVRAYRGGTKKAVHKSTLPYWKRYVSYKESRPFRKPMDDGHSLGNTSNSSSAPSPSASPAYEKKKGTEYWDSRTSPEDMETMWSHPDVAKEWTKGGEKRGKVRFSCDSEKRPYVSRVELKALAEIILFKYFSNRDVNPTVLCALAEMVSMRFVNGAGPRVGLMGIDYSTAFWLYMEMGHRVYRADSDEDLKKPFVSMYFGAAYLAWLSEYEGRERTPDFVVQAYLAGPQNVNPQDTGTYWQQFKQIMSKYEGRKKDQGSCSIL